MHASFSWSETMERLHKCLLKLKVTFCRIFSRLDEGKFRFQNHVLANNSNASYWKSVLASDVHQCSVFSCPIIIFLHLSKNQQHQAPGSEPLHHNSCYYYDLKEETIRKIKYNKQHSKQKIRKVVLTSETNREATFCLHCLPENTFIHHNGILLLNKQAKNCPKTINISTRLNLAITKRNWN